MAAAVPEPPEAGVALDTETAGARAGPGWAPARPCCWDSRRGRLAPTQCPDRRARSRGLAGGTAEQGPAGPGRWEGAGGCRAGMGQRASVLGGGSAQLQGLLGLCGPRRGRGGGARRVGSGRAQSARWEAQVCVGGRRRLAASPGLSGRLPGGGLLDMQARGTGE